MNDNYRKFLNEPMPCDGCVHNSDCKAKRKACYAFGLFVYRGVDNWTLPRKPTKSMYRQIMFDFDNSLKIQIFKTLKEKELTK